VVDKGLDEAFLLEVSDGDAGEGTVDLHALDEDGLRDHLEGGDLLHDAVVGGLVADDSVVGLVLYFTFRPLLLLGSLGGVLRSGSSFRPVYPTNYVSESTFRFES